MTDESYVYGTAGLMAATFLLSLVTRKFDPFAPIWLFFVGYFQVYVIQAIILREWAIGVRGIDLVTAANFRAFWAILWFLAVYYSGIGKLVCKLFPSPPKAWSAGAVSIISPPLFVWGLFCAYMIASQNWATEDSSNVTAEEFLLRSFPFLLLVSGVLLLITGRTGPAQRPVFAALGLCICLGYVAIWMFNGKRSHSLIGVLATVCGFYITRLRRPSWGVLFTTAFVGSMVVTLAIGWRNNRNYERSPSGFVEYVCNFDTSSILKNLNIEDDEEHVGKAITHETLEYGGFLLMLDTVPEKSGYDYGANYLRCFSTFIPRVIWADKPLYGREQWIGAWRAGSELKREEEFTGPAIGIMGATQLNGGAVGTAIVLAVVAIMLSSGYAYFRKFEAVPWVQAFWTLTFYNAWFMTVADDPMNWFYYNYGFSCLPVLSFLWVFNAFKANESEAVAGAPQTVTVTLVSSTA